MKRFMVTYTDRPPVEPFRRWAGDPPPFIIQRFDSFDDALDWIETTSERVDLFVPVLHDLGEGRVWSWPEVRDMIDGDDGQRRAG